jgi:hypothetical protein
MQPTHQLAINDDGTLPPLVSTGTAFTPVCACCAYRASEDGVAVAVITVEGERRTIPPGLGAVREVEVVPGRLWANACEVCSDGQCNGCNHCATHCSCPPNTGRPSWQLPADAVSS